ncbi:long-chain fatty acid--CoA ligase [Maritalea porphyrae]|uniref:AMP-dependent synthetase n=1 Tax=Maritalea porphyrae TaxID=880732 RepID=A0ABQ5UQG5_9HYPH|nr:AMP-dependent synthetase [Maritalea porphyrae]
MTVHREISGSKIKWDAGANHAAAVQANDTLPKMLLANAKAYPNDVAQREKDFGIWNEITWGKFNSHVKNMALAFDQLGVKQGDVVAIIGDNRPEWVWGEIAAHTVKAMSLGIYREALEEEIAYLVDYAKPKVVVAEDEEQVDKFLELGDRIPSIEKIIYHDPRGMKKYDDPRLIFLADLEKMGEEAAAKNPGRYEELVAATQTDDVAVLCTTSGTTSNPKLAMWKHSAFLGHAVNYLRADPMGAGDEYLAVLPLSWVMEQMYSVAWNLVARMIVNFPEEEETAMSDLREIGPHFVLLSPRVWEVVAADIRARMMESSPWKQTIFDWGVKAGISAVERGERSQAAELILFRALRDRLGFSRLKSAATGGAAMGPDTFKFFQAMGVPLKQLYGQTEGLGAYTIHKWDDIDHDTVGFPMNDCTIKIRNADDEGMGEIIVNHPNLMTGYYKNTDDTDEAFDQDGNFLTGDAGYLNDKNHLVVVDRIKDLSETSKGIKFSPQFIENKLKFSTFVAEAVILGKDQPYISAMICIRYPIVSKWAEQRRIAFTTYTDLASRPEIYELLRKEVEAVNEHLPEAQRIKKFVLLYKELDADDGELTRTKKVRRGVIADKYADIIGKIYSDDTHVDIDTVIAFQDGTKQRIKTSLKVQRLDDKSAMEGSMAS